MSRPRDVQRSRVYSAEDKAFNRAGGPEYDSMDECKEYSELIVNSKYWKANTDKKSYTLHHGAGHRNAYFKRRGRRRIIVLPKWARKRWVIIHEFAHYLTYLTDGDAVPSHGRVFCTHYLNLIKELMGEICSKKLVDAFEAEKVKHYL